MTRLDSPRNDRVLAYVNRLRGKMGEDPITELPKGIPCNTWQCPIARSLPGSAMSGPLAIVAYTGDDRHSFTPPAYVRRWMNDFDNGLIVDLTDVDWGTNGN